MSAIDDLGAGLVLSGWTPGPARFGSATWSLADEDSGDRVELHVEATSSRGVTAKITHYELQSMGGDTWEDPSLVAEVGPTPGMLVGTARTEEEVAATVRKLLLLVTFVPPEVPEATA